MADNNQNQVFKCNGDCLNCRKLPNERREQWQYCASQFTYNSMQMLIGMQESLNTMQGTVSELKAKIEAIQSNEAAVFNPIATEDTAQSGDGEE